MLKKYRIRNRENVKKIKKQYRIKNKEKIKIKGKQYRIKNREKINERRRKYYIKNREKILTERCVLDRKNQNLDGICTVCKKTFRKKWTHLNKKYCSSNCSKKRYMIDNSIKYKQYRIKNKEKISKRNKEYRAKNKKILREKRKKNRKNNINFKLRENISQRIKHAIITSKTIKSKKTLELLGCSWDKARKHLESQFKEGMTWNNHGLYGWHIDHIIPCASFDLTDPEQQKKCFNYKNLQPLWWHENLSKGAKIIESKPCS